MFETEELSPADVKAIYRRAWGAAYRKRLPHHDAEDVVHSTILKRLADPSLDVYDTAWNAANHWRRSRSRTTHVLRYLRNVRAARQETELLMIRLDVRAAVVQLSRHEIRVVIDRFWRGMPYRRFAGWDKEQSRRAVNNLRHLLSSYGEGTAHGRDASP